MKIFDIGETVICSIEVRDDGGVLKDPETSMNIEIDMKPFAVASIISSIYMVKDGTGKYHYDFDTEARSAGDYTVKYTATDGMRITIEKDKFHLE